jgi:hypothetical protein
MRERRAGKLMALASKHLAVFQKPRTRYYASRQAVCVFVDKADMVRELRFPAEKVKERWSG